MKRVKYLNNRDLLAQIHASKNTYCSYVTPEDSQYDLIVQNLKKINPSAVAQARKAKAKRLTQEAWEQAKEAGLKKITSTKIWNKEGKALVGWVFEYENAEAYQACQSLWKEIEQAIDVEDGTPVIRQAFRGVVLSQTTL